MSSIRGLIFHSRLDYIDKYIDAATFKKNGEKLSPQARQVLFDQVFLVNKYPFEMLKELDKILPEIAAEAPEPLFRKIGRDFAKTILDRYFFNYVEAQKPHKFLQQFQRLYPNLWDFGRYELISGETQKVQVRLTYEEEVHPEYHWFMEEFFKAGVEICSGKHVTVNRVSNNTGSEESQVYQISWR